MLDAKKKMADAEAAKLIAYDQLSKGPGGLIASSVLRAASASTMLTTSAEWSYLGMQFSGGLAWATLLETGMFLNSGFKEKVPGTTVALTTKEAVKAMFSLALLGAWLLSLGAILGRPSTMTLVFHLRR